MKTENIRTDLATYRYSISFACKEVLGFLAEHEVRWAEAGLGDSKKRTIETVHPRAMVIFFSCIRVCPDFVYQTDDSKSRG